MGQGAQGGGRVVDQGLLVSVEHFITYGRDDGDSSAAGSGRGAPSIVSGSPGRQRVSPVSP